MSVKTYSILARTHCYTEGPVRDVHGNIFFTCPGTGEIKLLRQDAKMRTWAKLSRPNGQTILPNGQHLVCDSNAAAIYRFSGEGNLIGVDVKDECGGNKFSTPNDLAVDDGGGYFFRIPFGFVALFTIIIPSGVSGWY